MNSASYIIQSKIDNQQLKVKRNVIEASVLLKNAFEFTEITEPIVINCSSQSLKIFSELITHYPNTFNAERDAKFEYGLYKNFSDDQLIEIIQELCKLDSDFFLDSVTDYILAQMEKMTSSDIQEYLGLEDDFSANEREIIEKNITEYFLSINIDNMVFPFPNKSLYSMKTKFSTPFNALIARIIQRSNEQICHKLSTINKSIKNEIDRHPLKITCFCSSWNLWELQIDKPGFQTFLISLDTKKHDEKYFNIVLQRKIIAEKFEILYVEVTCLKETFTRCSSFDFVIPKNRRAQAHISFQSNPDLMYKFDVTKCPIRFIFFQFIGLPDSVKKFKEIFDHLIVKDLTKEIMLWIQGFVRFHRPNSHLRLYKKPNAEKLHYVEISNRGTFLPEFQNFITNYIDDNGHMNCDYKIKEIPKEKYEKIKGKYVYTVLVIREYLEKIITVL